MSMNPKWFKQVDGKPSRFAQLYHDYIGNVCDSVSHAFSTLLAEDAAADDAPTDTLWQYDVDARIATLERKVKRLRKRGKCHGNEILDVDGRLQKVESFMFDAAPAETATPAPTPRPFMVGDVVRLLDYEHNGTTQYCGTVAKIDKVIGRWCCGENYVDLDIPPGTWPASALELVTAVDAPSYDAEGEYTDKAKDSIKIIEHPLLQSALTASHAEVRRLEAQLPEGMKHCTILAKECKVGHGWLTATNWVQHDCPTCDRNALRAERDSLQAKLDAKFIRSDEPLTEEQLKVSREIASHAYMADCVLVHQPLFERMHLAYAKLPDIQNKLDAANADLAAYRALVEAGKVVVTDDFLSRPPHAHWVERPSDAATTKTALLIDEAAIAAGPCTVAHARSNDRPMEGRE